MGFPGASEAQVTGDYIAHWDFDEGAGISAADSSPNLHAATVYGAVWADGISGGALDFDGIDDYVGVQTSHSLDNLPAFTYEAWIKPRANSHWHVISKGTGSKRLYSETAGSTLDLTGRVRYSTTHAYGSSIDDTVTLNAWQHVAMTWSIATNSVKVYNDGIEVSYSYLTAGSGTIENDVQNPYTIGTRSDLVAGTFFDGIIDEVYIWSRVLTESEILSHYESMILPGQLGSLTATPGSAQVALSWEAGHSNTGAPIVGYRILRGPYPGAEAFLTEVGNITTYADTGLTNGQTYYYKVAAMNGNGTGPDSPEASATPRTVPGAPRDLHADAGDGHVYISWSPPATDGGSAITGYTVYRGTASGGETLLVSLGNVLNYNDTSVENGQPYFYIVVPANAAGDGAFSAEAGAIPGQAGDSGIGGGMSPGNILLVLFIITTVVLLVLLLYVSQKLRKKPVVREFAPPPQNP